MHLVLLWKIECSFFFMNFFLYVKFSTTHCKSFLFEGESTIRDPLAPPLPPRDDNLYENFVDVCQTHSAAQLHRRKKGTTRNPQTRL